MSRSTPTAPKALTTIASWAGGIAVGYLLLGNGISGWGWIATFVVSAVIYLALVGARGTLEAPDALDASADTSSEALAEVVGRG